ncbi:MAG: hypothetical protein IT183_05690 [Acidobacteria bacterium]|nr:hypothetical protein [Acidobacteriota bacterium]
MAHETYASDAWLLEGITRSVPGWLEWKAGRLRFVTPAEVVFDTSRSEVTNIRYPWYYFGGGLKLHASGVAYRLSFVKPNGAEHAVGRTLGEMGSPLALAVPAMKVIDIRSGRNVCRRWREILGDGPD